MVLESAEVNLLETLKIFFPVKETIHEILVFFEFFGKITFFMIVHQFSETANSNFFVVRILETTVVQLLLGELCFNDEIIQCLEGIV